MKTALTPGRLYSTLASEFRDARCSRCQNCILPLPLPVDQPAAGGPSWVLGALSRECDDCKRAITAIVRRNQALYDLIDPVTPAVKMTRPHAISKPAPSTGPWTH